MLSLDVDIKGLEQAALLAQATEDQILMARARTLRKMRKKVERLVKNLAAKKLRMPQKAIGDRFFSNSIGPGDDELKLWIGTWDISPFSLGTPTQMTFGVRAGSRAYPGAFLAQIYSGETKVWIRLYSRHYSPDLYPTRYRPGDRGGIGNKGRFPVVRAAVPIDGVMEEILKTHGADISRAFAKEFKAQLNYETRVKGAN